MLSVLPVDAVMRALADPTRRAVFEQLARGGEVNVAELTRASGVTQGAISQHLKSLKLAGLVSRIESAHGIQARFADAAVDALAARCTESETGARNVDQILRSSLLPELSRELLTHMAAGTVPAKLEVGLADQGRWTFAFEGVR